jgi:hypothetical protein
VGVADQDKFGAGGLDAVDEGDEVDVLGHPHLVENDHAVLVEHYPAVVEAPQQTGQGAGLAQLRLSAQGPRRLPRRGGADHPATRRLEGSSRNGQQGGLARAGDVSTVCPRWAGLDPLHQFGRYRRAVLVVEPLQIRCSLVEEYPPAHPGGLARLRM